MKVISLVSSLLLSLVIGASGQILRDDDFADGSRTGWYTSRASSDLVASSANGGSMTLLVGSSTNQIFTYFTDSGEPIALDIGQALQLTMDFSFSGFTKSATINPFLRIGLFNSGGKRLGEDDKSNVVDEFKLYRGYGLFASQKYGLSSSAKRTGTTSGALLVDGGPWTTQGSFDRSTHSFSFVDNVNYTLTMTFERTAAAEMVTTYLLTFGSEQFEYVVTDSSSVYSSFDTFGIAVGGSAAGDNLVTSMSVQSVHIEVIPEPGVASLLGLAGVGLLIVIARNRFRGETVQLG